MLNNLRHLATIRASRRIDHGSGVIIAINLAALDVLQPSVLHHLGDSHASRRIWVKHREEEASECGRMDMLVEESDMRVIVLGDDSSRIVGMFGVPFFPAAHEFVIDG